MSSYLSLHVLADGCTEPDINRAGRFLAACECEYYNLTTAARYNEAEKLIRLLRASAPRAKPIWRGWPSAALEDGGIWQRVKPQEWVNYRIAPNAKWLQELDVLVLTCNEVGALGADAQKWSEWEADCIRLTHIQFGVQLAVLRLSTGNPLESEHGNYNAVLQAAAEYDAVLSPNEYTSTRREITDKWHVGRYRWAWEQQDKLGVKRSPMVIGEYGIAQVNGDNTLDPYHGYGDVGVNTDEHLAIIRHDGLTYQADGISVCWFVFGHWQEGKGSFDVHTNEHLLSAVEVEAKTGRLNMTVNTIQYGAKYRLSLPGQIITAYRGTSISDKVLGTIPDNAIVEVGNKTKVGSDTWLQVRYQAYSGWGWIKCDLVNLRQTVEMPIVNVEPSINPAPAAPSEPPAIAPLPAPPILANPAPTPVKPPVVGYVLTAAARAVMAAWRDELQATIQTATARLAIIDTLLAK